MAKSKVVARSVAEAQALADERGNGWWFMDSGLFVTDSERNSGYDADGWEIPLGIRRKANGEVEKIPWIRMKRKARS